MGITIRDAKKAVDLAAELNEVRRQISQFNAEGIEYISIGDFFTGSIGIARGETKFDQSVELFQEALLARAASLSERLIEMGFDVPA